MPGYFSASSSPAGKLYRDQGKARQGKAGLRYNTQASMQATAKHTCPDLFLSRRLRQKLYRDQGKPRRDVHYSTRATILLIARRQTCNCRQANERAPNQTSKRGTSKQASKKTRKQGKQKNSSHKGPPKKKQSKQRYHSRSFLRHL